MTEVHRVHVPEGAMAGVFELTTQACVELFDAYGLRLAPSGGAEPADETACGILGFVGEQIRGSIVVSASLDVLARTDAEVAPGADWIGELANQLVGRLKSMLSARGVEISLATPIVLRGFALTPVPGAGLGAAAFSVEGGGIVRLWLDHVVDPAFVLGEPVDNGAMLEGDSLLFF